MTFTDWEVTLVGVTCLETHRVEELDRTSRRSLHHLASLLPRELVYTRSVEDHNHRVLTRQSKHLLDYVRERAGLQGVAVDEDPVALTDLVLVWVFGVHLKQRNILVAGNFYFFKTDIDILKLEDPRVF